MFLSNCNDRLKRICLASVETDLFLTMYMALFENQNKILSDLL